MRYSFQLKIIGVCTTVSLKNYTLLLISFLLLHIVNMDGSYPNSATWTKSSDKETIEKGFTLVRARQIGQV